MKKQILLDALSLTDEKPKGAQVYIFNLLKQFSIIDSAFDFTVLINASKSNFGLPQSYQIRYERIKTGHPSLWRLLKLSGYIKKRNFNLLHLMSEGLFLDNIPIPYVMTINESLKKYYKYSENKIGILNLKKRIAKVVSLSLRQKMVNKAALLIAISNSTKRDLINDCRPPDDKIKVIYWAADEAFFCNKKECESEDRIHKVPYILIFATGDKRENVFCELRAFARIKSEINHYLFIVGIPEGGFQKELTKRCCELEILDRTKFFNFLSVSKLEPIYKNADLYVDMSFFEGFGLQALEAMASGSPVITSNVDSLPEVVGDAGILLNPNDDLALADAILSVLKDSQKKQKMQAASRMQAEKFTWEKTAEETLKVYDEVICQRFQ